MLSETSKDLTRVPGSPMECDAITFEMIRHKFLMVVAEAMNALQNVSGSPSTSEALDVMVSLYDRDGNLMLGGVGFTHHITSAVQAVKHLLAEYRQEPGINEGDAFFLNDPYTAALHAPDVYMISPVHHDHELIGFVANFVHVTDIGALDPGGFSPNATESYHEGFQTGGLKLVERGTLRLDVLKTFLNMVRAPEMVHLDLKSQLAANHVAKQRIARIVEEFGAETMLWVAGELVDQSEQRFRARLRELPDGIWRARQYVDASTHLAKVELAVTKEDDTLVYDFTGSSEQLPVGVNCTYWAAWGALFAPVFPQFAWDLTWNEGITKPVRAILPEGTVVNCIKPAPTSISTVGVVQVINNLSTIVASKMLGATEKYRHRATAVWHGSHASVRTHGYRKSGEYFMSPLTDTFCGSGGATADRDGVDMGGELPNVVSRWGNVERHELLAPLIYLFRRRVIDSGGPGKYRGGLSHEFGFTVDATDLRGVLFMALFGKGVRSPMSHGLFGGYPGCPVSYATFRELSASDLLDRPGVHDSRAHEYSTWGTHTLGPRDLQVVRNNGGGGYGDPLDRDWEAVLRDVLDGAVSSVAAHNIYGVVIDEKSRSVDVKATRALRRAIRSERIGRSQDQFFDDRQDVPRSGLQICEYLQITPLGTIQCTWCGHQVAPSGRRWKDHAAVRRSPVSSVHDHSSDSEAPALVEYFCPDCASLLDCEVGLPDDPPLYDDIRYPRRDRY